MYEILINIILVLSYINNFNSFMFLLNVNDINLKTHKGNISLETVYHVSHMGLTM